VHTSPLSERSLCATTSLSPFLPDCFVPFSFVVVSSGSIVIETTYIFASIVLLSTAVASTYFWEAANPNGFLFHVLFHVFFASLPWISGTALASSNFYIGLFFPQRISGKLL
jgi:hypothetical protein